MVNQVTTFIKQNKRDITIFGLIGAGVYLLSKNALTTDFSTLQSSFGVGVLDKVVNLEIKTLLFFIFLGIFLGVLVSGVLKK